MINDTQPAAEPTRRSVKPWVYVYKDSDGCWDWMPVRNGHKATESMGLYWGADYDALTIERDKLRDANEVHVAALEQYQREQEANRVAIDNLRETLAVVSQALLEYQMAIERGPGWYTDGRTGMMNKLATWDAKALAAQSAGKGE